MKRYRVFVCDFDARARFLNIAIPEKSPESYKIHLKEQKENILSGLRKE